MPLPRARIGRRKKVARISPANSTARIFGRTPKALLKEIERVGGTDFFAVDSVRIFALPEARPRYFVLARTDFGSQILYEVIRKGRNISLAPEGRFSPGFAHRIIYGEKFRGRGIGTRALKTDRALSRTRLDNNHEVSTNQVSTIQMLLKNGYKITPDSLRFARRFLGVKDEKALLALTRKAKGDEIKMYLQMEKPLRAPTKK